MNLKSIYTAPFQNRARRGPELKRSKARSSKMYKRKVKEFRPGVEALGCVFVRSSGQRSPNMFFVVVKSRPSSHCPDHC